MPTEAARNDRLPKTFRDFAARFPLIALAHENIARSIADHGPLDRKACALIKIGICCGSGLESALRSHVRRALEHGATADEIEQAIVLTLNTCGFPRTVACWQWAREEIDRHS